MSAEQQPCSKASHKLLRQPWTLGVTSVRMGRGLCPGENSSAMTCKLASPTTVLRTLGRLFAKSGITQTFPPKTSCAASPVASFCIRPNPTGFHAGTAAGTASSSSSPTTSASSIILREEELTIRPTPLHLPAAPVPAPTQDAPPPPAPCPGAARARFALGMPPLPPGLPPSSEPQAASHPKAEPWAAPPAASPPSKAPPPHSGQPPSPASPFSPSSPASPAAPPPNRRPFNAFHTSAPPPQSSQASEDTASDTSDGPPPWDQPVEVDSMAEVKYQGPVTIHQMIDPVPGPSFDDVANAKSKCIPVS